jgi:hypothetical protein
MVMLFISIEGENVRNAEIKKLENKDVKKKKRNSAKTLASDSETICEKIYAN